MSKSSVFLIKLVMATILVIVVIAGVLYASNQLAANPLLESNQTRPSPTQIIQNPTNPSGQPSSTISPDTSKTTPTSNNPALTTSPSTETSAPTPTSSPIPPITATFDFDTGSPTLTASRSTPFDQTKDGVTAQFSSTSGIFSIQSYENTFYKLSQFQGKYLLDNGPGRDSLIIKFSQPLSTITFTFATFESHGAPTDQPSNITLTAYMDSTLIGLTKARGTWPDTDAYPQGTLFYDSGGQPFNNVKIELLYQGPTKALDYIVDTITVKTM